MSHDIFMTETDKNLRFNALREFGLNDKDAPWHRFWSEHEVQIDGTCTLDMLRAFVLTLERMQEVRRAQTLSSRTG